MAARAKTFIGKMCQRGHAGERYVRGRHCVACALERNRKNRSLPGRRDSQHDASLRFHYGMTKVEYDQILTLQKNKCAICGEKPTVKRLHVDHDHDSGAVRGLLCLNCNRGLGAFKDDTELVKLAVNYLQHPPTNQLDRS